MLGDAVVDAALAPKLEHLAALSRRPAPTESGRQLRQMSVQAHRGWVLQYAGDNILAAFGADSAADDDAERAEVARCKVVTGLRP